MTRIGCRGSRRTATAITAPNSTLEFADGGDEPDRRDRHRPDGDPIRAERHRPAAQAGPCEGEGGRERARPFPRQGEGGEENPVADEQPGGISVRVSRGAGTDPVEQGVGRDGQARGEGEGESRPVEGAAPRAQRHQHDAEREEGDAGDPGRGDRLPEDEERDERRQKRCAAARDRIDEPHIGPPIRVGQAYVIKEMDRGSRRRASARIAGAARPAIGRRGGRSARRRRRPARPRAAGRA